MSPLLSVTPRGLYCPRGQFYIDPLQPVRRAVVTHAHADHARPGSHSYLGAAPGTGVLRERLGPDATLETLPFGKPKYLGEVRVSFHPAGHILGSAQVRLEHRGEVWVVTGDYKRQLDPTCQAFEPLRCHTLVTESTFGLPVYRWPSQDEVWDEINTWWRRNQELRHASVIFAYTLGKAQRIMAGVDATLGPIFVHGAIARMNRAYRQSGVSLPEWGSVLEASSASDFRRALIIAPPSAAGTPWLRRFGTIRTALASGWMMIRGTRRRRAVDRGFVLSDHVDWPALLETVADTQAENVWVMHGSSDVVARYFRELGLNARVVTIASGGGLGVEDDEVAAPAGNPNTH